MLDSNYADDDCSDDGKWINADGLPLDTMEQVEAGLYESRRAQCEADKEIEDALTFYRRRWIYAIHCFLFGVTTGVLGALLYIIS